MATDNTTTDKPAGTSASPSNQVGKSGPKKPRERKLVEVTNDLPDVWEPADVGSYIEGFYIGFKEIKFRKAQFKTHMIQNEETGEVLSFSGAIADRKLEQVRKNTFVRVTYEGEIKTGNGDAKNWRIDRDESSRLIEDDEQAS